MCGWSELAASMIYYYVQRLSWKQVFYSFILCRPVAHRHTTRAAFYLNRKFR